MSDEYQKYLEQFAKSFQNRQGNSPEDDYTDLRYAIMNQANQWNPQAGQSGQDFNAEMIDALLQNVPDDRLHDLMSASQTRSQQLRHQPDQYENNTFDFDRILAGALSARGKK